jgi:hypothetical protein
LKQSSDNGKHRSNILNISFESDPEWYELIS